MGNLFSSSNKQKYSKTKKMRALVVNKQSCLEYKIDDPQPLVSNDDQVLVEVFHTGVNIADVIIYRFFFPNLMRKINNQRILGFDFSGKIVDLGDNAKKKGFQVGDIICCAAKSWMTTGANSEYAAVDYRYISRIPKGISLVQAACSGIPSLTAYRMCQKLIGEDMKDVINDDIKGCLKGKSVVVIGCSGGVGTYCTMFASKLLGAKVYGVSSLKNHEYIKKLGVDVCIDYHTTKIEDVVKNDKNLVGFLDCIGGDEYRNQALKLLQKEEQKYVYASNGHAQGSIFKIMGIFFHNRNKKFHLAHCDPEGFIYESILKWMGEEDIAKLVNIEQFPLKDGMKVHDFAAKGKTKGRLVLDVKENIEV